MGETESQSCYGSEWVETPTTSQDIPPGWEQNLNIAITHSTCLVERRNDQILFSQFAVFRYTKSLHAPSHCTF